MILNLSHKVLNKMEQSDAFRFVVLAVVIVNFVGVVILPPLLYLLGGSTIAQFHPYVDLLWSVLLVATLIYYSKYTDSTHARYFDNKVPALLIALYFVTIVIVFVLKTVGFPVVYRLATEFAAYDMEMIRMQIWAPVTYALYVWQLYVLHSVSQKELV